MKPTLDALCVVTATCDAARAASAITSWLTHATYRWPLVVIENGDHLWVDEIMFPEAARSHHTVISAGVPDILGVVPAFAKGLTLALQSTKASIIVCLHDDVWIDEPGWDARIVEHFSAHPACGLAGFGGATSLGHSEIYQIPYDPMQLARGGFRSNMREAESHGTRTTEAQRVACLDGFSQIGRREYWQCLASLEKEPRTAYRESEVVALEGKNLFWLMEHWGIVHHAYDAALGCFAARLGWETWLTPIACHHHGGLTAVAHAPYHEWADAQVTDTTPDGGRIPGDTAFWHHSHRIVYDQFKDVLPLTTKE